MVEFQNPWRNNQPCTEADVSKASLVCLWVVVSISSVSGPLPHSHPQGSNEKAESSVGISVALKCSCGGRGSSTQELGPPAAKVLLSHRLLSW